MFETMPVESQVGASTLEEVNDPLLDPAGEFNRGLTPMKGCWESTWVAGQSSAKGWGGRGGHVAIQSILFSGSCSDDVKANCGGQSLQGGELVVLFTECVTTFGAGTPRIRLQ